MVERQTSFPIILELISWELNIENILFHFCVGIWVLRINLKIHKNSTSFDAYEGWNCVGWAWIKETCLKAQLDGNVILYIFVNLDSKTPTQISTTHAFSKIRTKIQNRIPRELDKNFDILRITKSVPIHGNKQIAHGKNYTVFSRN